MKAGAYVEVTTKEDTVFTGTVLPAEGLVLKLNDGYNLGIDERNIKHIKELPAPEKPSSKTKEIKKDNALPNVVLLHTGGTIASKVDYETGATTNLITPKELLNQYPELQSIAHLLAEFITNMSTEDFRFAQYNILAQAIAKHVQAGVKGVVISMGTDLMHTASAAMHYALRGLAIPVVFVGSQRSADRGSTDAPYNLQAALHFITQTQLPGVFVAMHASSHDDDIHILRGINVRKMHTSRRDAFKPINIPAVARVQQETVTVLAQPPTPQEKFEIKLFKEDLKIGMCYVHPQFYPQELRVYNDFDGLIVLGSGLGAMPTNANDDLTAIHKENAQALQELLKNMPVVMTSQCIHGRVSLQVYSSNRKLQEMGVLGHDLALSPETAFIKLAWILSQGMNAQEGMYQDFEDSIARVEEQTYD